MAVLAQFYLAFPLLLLALRPRSPGFRRRLAAALAAAVVGGTAWRLRAAHRIDFLELPVSDFAVDAAAQRSWANMLACARRAQALACAWAVCSAWRRLCAPRPLATTPCLLPPRSPCTQGHLLAHRRPCG